jgi:serine phosphatase RsbU (regulator of sigma subunit)
MAAATGNSPTSPADTPPPVMTPPALGYNSAHSQGPPGPDRSSKLTTETAAVPATEMRVAVAGREAASRRQVLAATGAVAMPPLGLLVSWALGSLLVGAAVAAGIAFTREGMDLGPVFLISILFAEVVGFTALLAVRLVFPLFEGLPNTVNHGLQVLTLLAGTLFGSVMVLMSQPYFTLARIRTVAMIILINAALAIIVGIGLRTYDSMRRQIEAQYQALREKEAMERELSIAREVQRELLPRACPVLPGLEVAGACRPAIGVGGDYYDYLTFADDRLGLVIADVAGKGIPAALLMAGLQGSVRSIAAPSVDPGEVNCRLNGMLYRSTTTARYATLFFAIFDARSRMLAYSNAGHFPPLHLSARGVDRLTADGIPLGLMEDARYGQGQRRLESGDLLVLYTDGIVEAPDPSGAEFGEDRLVEALRRYRDRNLEEIILSVLRDIERWTGGGPAHDDATLVLVRAT